jgi:hypothetical protein
MSAELGLLDIEARCGCQRSCADIELESDALLQLCVQFLWIQWRQTEMPTEQNSNHRNSTGGLRDFHWQGGANRSRRAADYLHNSQAWTDSVLQSFGSDGGGFGVVLDVMEIKVGRENSRPQQKQSSVAGGAMWLVVKKSGGTPTRRCVPDFSSLRDFLERWEKKRESWRLKRWVGADQEQRDRNRAESKRRSDLSRNRKEKIRRTRSACRQSPHGQNRETSSTVHAK